VISTEQDERQLLDYSHKFPGFRGELEFDWMVSSDGAEVGTIADVRLDEGGGLSAVRVDAGARLGFGTKQVEIPGRAVTIVRGAAVLALPKEAVEMLPSISRGRAESGQTKGRRATRRSRGGTGGAGSRTRSSGTGRLGTSRTNRNNYRKRGDEVFI
jgi:hypothetical protein